MSLMPWWPRFTFTHACVAIAPTLGAAWGSIAPTHGAAVAEATPNSPSLMDLATIENVASCTQAVSPRRRITESVSP